MTSLEPDWPAPANVHAFFTRREGGVSRPPYDSLNLADHVGDDPAAIAENRRRLSLDSEPCWLQQVHSSACVRLSGPETVPPRADAAITSRPDTVLVVMVADCLPILLCSTDAQHIGVVHAGWRGLAGGVIDAAIDSLGESGCIAWLGPGIGPCHYQVDEVVRQSFPSGTGFMKDGKTHYRLDLYAAAKEQLESRQVQVFGGGFCTYCDETSFFSHRRDGTTGRMGAFIWRTP